MNARDRLRQWRKDARLTQERAAELFECSRDMLAFIERGTRHPGLGLAHRIEKVTGIPAPEWVALKAQAEQARKAS